MHCQLTARSVQFVAFQLPSGSSVIHFVTKLVRPKISGVFTVPAGSTLSHEIAQILRGEILDQRYREGDRLPSERAMAARFNASRGAIREAFSQLEQLGIIAVLPGGARVKALSSASISVLGPLMARGVSPDLVLVRQFLQTFGSLAAQNAREALACADAAQMNCIREMVVSLDEEEPRFSVEIPRWQRLLEYLATTADNLVIRLITNDLKAQFVAQMTALAIQPQIDKRVVAHALMELRESVSDRNGDRAAAAVTIFFDALTESVIDACQPRHAPSARAG